VKTSTLRLRLFIIAVLCFSAFFLRAQDIHFSQFGNSPLNLNPAMAGVFGGDMRFVGNYRSQSNSIPVPYLTFSGSVENKVYLTKGRYDRFITGSLLLNYDRQGSLNLTSMQIGIPLSLTLPVANRHFLTAAIMPAFGQRAFNTNKLTFDAQWVDCIFDPNASAREDQLFQSNSLKYFDLGAGFNYRGQAANKRSRVDLGAGFHHLNRPHHDFWSANLSDPGEVRLQRRLTAYGIGLLQATDKFDLVGKVMYQRQGGYRELVYGGAIRFHLNQKVYNELALQIGVDVRQRYGDALIPHAEIHWRTWTLGFTYDMNLFSQINQLTDRRGGPEAALMYKLKPLPTFKSCPII
jgi:type IX secretion system PorP/SprF family membrane protein